MNTTSELAVMTNAPYFTEYVNEGSTIVPYYQLVRTKDEAILCTGTTLSDLYAYCFTHRITADQVTIW